MLKKKKIVFGITCFVILAIVATFAFTSNSRQYSKAMKLYNAMSYSKAALEFDSLKDYKESRMYYEECILLISTNDSLKSCGIIDFPVECDLEKSISGENNIAKVNIHAKQEFIDYEYDKQVDIFSTINNNLVNEFEKCTFFNDFSLSIYIDENNIFTYSMNNGGEEYSIVKNHEVIYTEDLNLKDRITHKLQTDEYYEYLFTITDIDLLKSILKETDVEIAKKEILYNYGKIKLNEKDYNTAKEVFKQLNYKDSNELYSNSEKEYELLHEYDGEWYGTNGLIGDDYKISHKWIINGDYCYNIYSDEKTKNGIDNYYGVKKNNRIYVFEHESDKDDFSKATFVFVFSGDVLTYDFNSYTKMTLNKISDSVELPETSNLKEPSIGMTSNDVIKSTWGKPDRVNKSTYSWGTREQWVYEKKGYIYIEDGVVTSITEKTKQ